MEETEKKVKEEELIEIRKEKFSKFFTNSSTIYYILLAFLVWFAMFIRTRNVPGLIDISTGTWTLGPDLDPFLFLRWAHYIADHGKLMVIDTMRYVPLGFDTSEEMKLLSYFVAYFYKFLTLLPHSIITLLPGHPSEVTVNYAAVMYPVAMFGLTCIAFFLLTRKIFSYSFKSKHYANIIALISVFFLSVIPALLPRTIAGIPEKESTGFLFIFLAFYFLIHLFESKNYKTSIIYSVLAGIATAALGLVWGGITFVFMIAGISAFIYFIAGRMRKQDLVGYTLWMVVFFILSNLISSRYTLTGFFLSTSTIPITFTILASAFNLFVYKKIKDQKHIKKLKEKTHISEEVISCIITIIILLILVLILRPHLITDQAVEVIDQLIHPFGTSRVALTVAENQEPYYSDWQNNFGPVTFGIPLFFWIFMIGSIVLFYHLVEKFEKRERVLITVAYSIGLFGLIFSKYSSNSILNGTSFASVIVYFGCMAIFLISSIYILHKYTKENKKELLHSYFGLILIFTMFFVSIVAARGGSRLIMVLVPPTSIIASYFIVNNFALINKQKQETMKTTLWIVAIVIAVAAIYAGYYLYQVSYIQSENFKPGAYQWQWQKAMGWVRDNTSTNAVFGHWWDYGYWLQSIGDRATVLDGGNAINYWDYLMAREVLTNPSDGSALSFLYTHNATHFLIDSSDIGKYTAFSSIGSDLNYDRYSYIPTFLQDMRSTKETATGVQYYYSGGFGLDDDVVINNNGTQLFFPKSTSGVGAILIEQNASGMNQPRAVFIQQTAQTQTLIPLRYMYYNNTYYDFGSGLDTGVFVMETVNVNSQNQVALNDKGALFYLSNRTVHSFLARKYLFNESGSFQLVHTEPSYITGNLRSQGLKVADFSYLVQSDSTGQIINTDFLGPIKIWQINYPSGMTVNQTYLLTDYPDSRLALSSQ